MGQEKDRLLRLIDFLAPDPEARARYEQGAENATEEEAAQIADKIEAILNATPNGQEAIKKFIATVQWSHDKKPRS